MTDGGGRLITVRQTNWWMMLPPVGVLLALMAVAFFALGEFSWRPPVLAGVVWMAYTYSMRGYWLGHNRAGLRALRKGEWDRSIDEHRQAAERLAASSWVDRHRHLTLMSASRIAYREAALVNIGYAHLQAGDAVAAREAYEYALAEYPGSELARGALHTMRMGAEAAGTAASGAAADGAFGASA